MKKAKQFTVRISNRRGALGEFAAALWEKGINIRALLADVHRGQGQIHLVVDKPAAAREVLARRGSHVTEEEIIVLTLADRPGSLAVAVKKLGKAGINIQYAYTGPAKAKGKLNVYLAVSDPSDASKILR